MQASKTQSPSCLSLLASVALGDLRRLFIPIVVIAVSGALLGFCYLSALRFLEALLGPEEHSLWIQGGILVAVGLAVGILKKALGNPGEMELLVDNIHVLGGHDDVGGSLRSLVPVSLLCVAGGGAAGPEAPLVQTTGTLGTWIAKRFRVSLADRRVLTITGMAAGFTVLFGAPLGAGIFALEILHRQGLEYYEALIPALVGSLCGYAVFVAATGLGLAAVWNFPSPLPLHPINLAWALVAGAGGAGMAVVFTYLNSVLSRVFSYVPGVARETLGGAVLALLAFWSPFALTFGEKQLGLLIAGPAAAAALAIAVAAKLIGTSATISSGWRGGFIIPLFFIGAALGRLLHLAFPQTNEVVLMAAFMVSINTGVTKTPIGSTLVVTEMAGLPLLPSALVAAITSLLLTSQVRLIHTQRQRAAA